MRRPEPRLPTVGHALPEAMRGLGVHLTIVLPHDGEVAAICAVEEAVLGAFSEA